MLVSTVPISMLGAHFAMGVRPFWTPDQYSEPCGLATTRRKLIYPWSSRHRYAMRERHRLYLCDAELCAQRTRVRPFLPRTSKSNITRACCSENRDKTETYLAFGASRFEACRPLAVEGVRLALMPVINQMRCAARASSPFPHL